MLSPFLWRTPAFPTAGVPSPLLGAFVSYLRFDPAIVFAAVFEVAVPTASPRVYFLVDYLVFAGVTRDSWAGRMAGTATGVLVYQRREYMCSTGEGGEGSGGVKTPGNALPQHFRVAHSTSDRQRLLLGSASSSSSNRIMSDMDPSPCAFRLPSTTSSSCGNMYAIAARCEETMKFEHTVGISAIFFVFVLPIGAELIPCTRRLLLNR